MKNLGPLLPFLLLIVAACHHNNNNSNGLTPVNSTSPGGLGPTIPAGAAGALYAINSTIYNNNGPINCGTCPDVYDSSSEGTAYGWFGNYTSTLDAGSIVVNGDTLVDTLFGIPQPWYEYETANYAPIAYTTNAVAWEVQGRSTNSIPAFNYTDNATFPVVKGLTLSYPVSISSPVTVHFSVLGAYDAIFYSLSGSTSAGLAYPPLNFTGNQGATSVTFSSAQLNQVTNSGGQLSIQVMPVKLTPYTIAGKTYYFVKQNAFAVNSTVQ